jgi:hypothetical protein
MQAVYAKAGTFASWQFGTFPYLPFPYQWHARYQQLEKHRIAGAMETWSYGFKPNWVAELRAWYSWSDAPPLDDLLGAVARREFGAGTGKLALDAWDRFSRAMTVEHSWTDQQRWIAGSGINPYWPYAPTRVILWPDFTNQVNVAARYAKPFSLPVFNKYLLLAADEMEAGLRSYRQAALSAPPAKKFGAYREVLLAEQLQRMMRSDQAILEFEDLRFHLDKTSGRAARSRMLLRMSAILKDEIARTRASLETQRRDSRLGYEWEQDYFYTPYVLEEKLKLLRVTLDQQVPAYRKRHGL